MCQPVAGFMLHRTREKDTAFLPVIQVRNSVQEQHYYLVKVLKLRIMLSFSFEN